MTSIFSRSWMCRLCGREACAECFEQVRELTEDRLGASQAEIAALQVRREKHAHTNPFFLACTRRNEHQAKDFSPMSRFCNAELAQVIHDMETLLSELDQDVIDPTLDSSNPPLVNDSSTPSLSPELASTHSTTDSTGVQTPSDASSTNRITSKADPSTTDEYATEPPYHPTRWFTDDDLTDEVFRPIWARGEPLVVTALLNKFRIKWTPEYFMEKYGTQTCLVIECQADVNKRVSVSEFFSRFGKYENRSEWWKLKVIATFFSNRDDALPVSRIGRHQQTSRRRSRNCMMTSVMRSLCRTM
jgi:[histone H3]-dimethyl-L-lysine9 demethylase